jgi:hypothetical protein
VTPTPDRRARFLKASALLAALDHGYLTIVAPAAPEAPYRVFLSRGSRSYYLGTSTRTLHQLAAWAGSRGFPVIADRRMPVGPRTTLPAHVTALLDPEVL